MATVTDALRAAGRRARRGLLVGAIAAGLPLAASAADRLPAHAAGVRVTVEDPPDDDGFALANVSLRAGRPKRILRVEVAVEFTETGVGAVAGVLAGVTANGVPVSLASGALRCESAEGRCHVLATGWMDLDEVEAQVPGSVLRAPLQVSAEGRIDYADQGEVHVDLLAELLKK
jgi:hypothetical protein